VSATIAWIREKFAVAAKRQDRFCTARLVRNDATRIAGLSLDLPSLIASASVSACWAWSSSPNAK